MSADLTDARRILAVRLDTIGDVIMTTPALAALADGPARVTLLTSGVSASLSAMLPYLHEVITLDVPWMKPAEKRREPHATHLAHIDELRSRAFDAAVIFTVSTQDPSCAAYLCYLAGIPRVACYARGKLYGLATHALPDPDPWPPTRHEVVRQIQLVEALGFPVHDKRLRLAFPAPSPKVRRVLDRMPGRRWVVVHPGATAPSRRYTNAGWIEVIDRLHAKDVAVVLAGARQDAARCKEIALGCTVAPLRIDGRLTLPELASFLRSAPAAITCNSSAAHLCAAAGTPVITLYAGTNPQHRPWMAKGKVLRHRTDCTWCLSSTCPHGEPVCLSMIEPERVVRHALRHLPWEDRRAAALGLNTHEG